MLPLFESQTRAKQFALLPRPKEKTASVRFFLLVGVLGFEPRISRSQSEHVSRYTIPRYIGMSEHKDLFFCARTCQYRYSECTYNVLDILPQHIVLAIFDIITL